MIALLDTSDDLSKAESEIGVPVGRLLTPLTRFSLEPKIPFAIDNGAFSRFDEFGFRSLISREDKNRARCLFVAVPDVVGSARRTLEAFQYWAPRLTGWPLALVAQDGIEEFIPVFMVKGLTNWTQVRRRKCTYR